MEPALPIGRAVIVSPHFDDAILSASRYVIERRPALITVCGAVPAGRTDAANWDRSCGFATAEEALGVRREEDAAVAARLALPVDHLPFLDHQYGGADPSRIAEALRRVFRDGDEIWLPAALGGHPDHVRTRDAALAAAAEREVSLVLYGDAPYQSYATGRLDVEGPLADPASAALADRFRLEPVRDLRLTDEQMAAKLALVRLYASQLAPLAQTYHALTHRTGPLSRERSWRLARA
jgi:LmbE family N-acetylglucosaminyl deacetylase